MSKHTGRKVAAAVALVAATTLVLSGCATGGTEGESGAAPGDDRIKLAMMQPPTAALNPYSDDVMKISRWSTGETLVRINDALEAEPLLATEWEQTDDLTWVFTLREGVTFHDGTEFTAEAVKNSIDHAVAAPRPPRVIKGVTLTAEVTGDNEITVTTDVPDPLLVNRLASPQMSILSAAAYLDDGNVTPVGTGTGPFELVELNGTSTATLDRYDDYWGDVAQLAGIDVDFVPDGTARAGAIRSGEVNIAESVPVSQVTLLNPDDAHEVFMPRTSFLTLNSESGPFADPAVRAAARAAIDPSVIVDTVYEGQADPAVGLLGPAIEWAEDMRGDVESSVKPAKVDGITITLATYTDRAENPEIAVQLEKQLEDAGFIVEQDVREYVAMEGEMLDGAFDAVVVSRNTLLDMGDPLSFLSQDFTCEGGFNIAQLCNAEVDELIDAGMQVAGDDRRQATMDAEAAVLQLDAVIPLVHERVVQAETGGYVDILRDPLERRLITEHTKRG
ncbi:ABC transporter substrate-binding protein [Microbacterium oxydans]|uniref:Glutathione-binding protein GsiB n=1 Tax=Microbacterium oxydans TaxID=82380 RepID=A0A0F0L7G3_9MICO|nr:ABC transporter substrate-binding protein [Microbacterium oxydans]KJL29088.1 Glutathione-binding protein GsiB precursor [Microbacterium oxydans]